MLTDRQIVDQNIANIYLQIVVDILNDADSVDLLTDRRVSAVHVDHDLLADLLVAEYQRAWLYAATFFGCT